MKILQRYESGEWVDVGETSATAEILAHLERSDLVLRIVERTEAELWVHSPHPRSFPK